MSLLKRSSYSKNKFLGFTLIEVLVAVLLFAIGILGIIQCQLKSLTLMSESDSLFKASLALKSISDLHFINAAQALQHDWQQQIANALLAGRGDISFASNHQLHVEIKWKNRQHEPTKISL